MLLSIVMMVKNEEKILEKTLSSLKDLRNKLNTELIILDTGSTDKTIDIAKRYTDKVYIENWNDNFSDMRNKSISYANGEWILIIDADEVLTDDSKLINFFENRLYENYKSASISLKNLYSKDKLSYGNTSILRMFENKDFSYYGSIHEQPHYKAPIYNEVASFEHYGYLFEDEEFKIKKLKRNEDLLIKELEKDKNNEYVNYQLGKNLITEGKYNEGIKYLENSLRLHESKKLHPEYLYNNIAKTYLNLKKYQKCENICKKYIHRDNKNIDIYFYLGVSRYTLSKYESSIKSFERYLHLINNYEETTQYNSLCCESDTIGLVDDVIIMIINSLHKLEEHGDIIDYFNNIQKQENKNKVYSILLESLYKLDKLDKITYYFDEISNSEVNKNEFYNAIEYLVSIVEDKDINDVYIQCIKLGGDYKVLNNTRLGLEFDIQNIKQILQRANRYYYSDLIQISIKNNIDLIDLIKDLNSIDIENYMINLIQKDKSFGVYLHDYIMNLENKFDINSIRLNFILSKVVIHNVSLAENKYIDMFYIYNMYSYIYIKLLYREFEDEDILKYLDNHVYIFNIEFRNIIQTKYIDENTINKLKDMIYKYPYYKQILNHLIENIKDELVKGDEFIKLKEMLIQNISNMISRNEIDEAKSIINDYINEFKLDSKLLNILGVISYIDIDIKNANRYFKKALSYDLFDEDIIYNIKNIK